MKTNNTKKIVVSVLALAMGAGLAGSISGSVAWYQYSTRAAASIAGTSAGTTRNLLVSKTGTDGWAQYVSYDATTFKPASVYYDEGNLVFVEHPVYQYEELPAAQGTGYKAEYTFYFKCMDNNGGGEAQVADKDIYLSYFAIRNTSTGAGAKDITPAVRVFIDGTNDFLISASGAETVTNGSLDLNNNTHPDTEGFDTLDSGVTPINYKNKATIGLSYQPVAPAKAVVNTDNAYEFASNDTDALSKKVLTKTKASGASDAVTVTIWIEGWQQLGGSSLWDATWISQNFAVDMQFSCTADR